MPTWMIFIGAEAIAVIITIIWILCFMRGGDKEDEYDRRLKELTEITEARRAKTYAKREETAEEKNTVINIDMYDGGES